MKTRDDILEDLDLHCESCTCPHEPTEALRLAAIRWLEWNDRNGCYADGDCDSERLPRLTLAVALGLVLEQQGA